MDLFDINLIINEIQSLDKEDKDFNKKCEQIVIAVKNGSLSVLQLIEGLGPLLSHTSPFKREIGVLILFEILDNLSKNSLNSQQLSIISTFFADRLKDNHQVIPAVLRGIISLSKFDNFPDGSATQILTSLFQHVACQQQQQPDRLNIYTIFKIFLEKHHTELCSMGLDFVYGVISSIDTERDPKNLLYLFQWIPTFLKSVSFGHLIEEMFEVLACYFPVDFRAPPQDPNRITRESLSESLCPCLCGIPEFAEYTIPLAIEKLQSSLLMAKLDSLKLLGEGCKIFDISSYNQHSSEIWSIIQKELMDCKEPELETACLETLKIFIKKLSQSDIQTFTGILKNITDTVKGNLLPDSRLFEPSVKLLIHVALACEKSSSFMLKEIVPVMINTYNITTTKQHQSILLKPLIEFVKVFTLYNKNIIDTEELRAILILCLKASINEDSDLQACGFNGLSILVDYLPEDVRKSIYLNMITLIPTDTHKVRKSIIECFKALSLKYQNEIDDLVINKIEIKDDQSMNFFLEALCEIANIQYFTNTVINNLYKYSFSYNGVLNYTALKNVHLLLNKECSNSDVQNIIKIEFFDILVTSAINNPGTIEYQTELLTVTRDIVKLIVGYQKSDVQREMLNRYFHVLVENRDKCNQAFVVIMYGLLIRLQRDVVIDYNILPILTNVSLHHDFAFIRETSTELIANLLNKCPELKTLDALLTNIKKVCKSCIDNISNNTIDLISWVTKALVMRNTPQSVEWEQLLIENLEKYEYGAKGFRIVMDDRYESISTKNNCNIMVLYKQKFFTTVSGKLSKTFSPEKASHLTAIGNLIEFLPNQILLMQFVKLKNLILNCLDHSKEPEVLCVILTALKTFITNEEKVIEDHLEDLLTRILNLTLFELSMNVRIQALQCLQHISGAYPIFKLLPFKQKVITQLGICIDDRKRFVRQEAVLARSQWFLLDAPL